MKEIKKFETLGKSIYKTLKSGWTIVQDLFEGDSLSFRSDATAKKTTITNLFVPQDGSLRVTSDCSISTSCAVMNGVDLLFTAWSLADDITKIIDGAQSLSQDDVSAIKTKLFAKLVYQEEYLKFA